MGPMHGQFHPLARRYLLVNHIPLYRDADGALWTDEGWHKDLVLHLAYLTQFVLAAPVLPLSGSAAQPARLLQLPDSLQVVALPPQTGRRTALRTASRVLSAIDGAVQDADIVQIGVVGWPYPIGWIGAWRALRRSRKLVLVVESAPWRSWTGPRGRFLSAVFERAAKYIATRATLLIATQPHYLAELRGRASRGRAEVQFASWVDPDQIADESAAAARWAQRLAHSPGSLRVLFAGRLVAEKGVRLLIEAARSLPSNVQIDVIGDGPLRGEIGEPLRLLDSVAYGQPFFELLQRYDSVVVPSLSDEQPRVVFDAWSQGVPVVAADTDGLRACVQDGVTGRLFRAGSVTELVQTLTSLTPAAAAAMGMAGLRQAPDFTHSNMHRRRSQMLSEVFA